jgi:hypothetical protein
MGRWIICSDVGCDFIGVDAVRRGRDVGVLFGEDADDAGGNFAVDYGLVVFAYDIDTAFFS